MTKLDLVFYAILIIGLALIGGGLIASVDSNNNLVAIPLLNTTKAIDSGYEMYELLGLYQLEILPEVCIAEPLDEEVNKRFHDEGYFQATIEGIVVWQDSMNDFTKHYNPNKGKSWNVDITYMLADSHRDKEFEEFPICDIFILYEGQNLDSRLGQTSYDFADSSHKYSIITIWTESFNNSLNLNFKFGDPSVWETDPNGNPVINVPKQELQSLSYEAVRQISSHEFGHALGLGHYFPGDDNPSKSIMIYQFNPWDSRTFGPPQALDLYALMYKYDTDGFKLWEYGNLDDRFLYPLAPPKSELDNLVVSFEDIWKGIIP